MIKINCCLSFQFSWAQSQNCHKFSASNWQNLFPKRTWENKKLFFKVNLATKFYKDETLWEGHKTPKKEGLMPKNHQKSSKNAKNQPKWQKKTNLIVWRQFIIWWHSFKMRRHLSCHFFSNLSSAPSTPISFGNSIFSPSLFRILFIGVNLLNLK